MCTKIVLDSELQLGQTLETVFDIFSVLLFFLPSIYIVNPIRRYL